MDAIQTQSVSSFRNNYDAVLKKLPAGPVLLLQRSTLAAVVVLPEEWNALQTQLNAQAKEIVALKTQLRNAILDKHALEIQYVPGMSIPWEQVQQELKEQEAVHA
jgi:PHD/YefM family antitoxin component YafN of YafNO toxin-antitoxin module